MCVEQALVNILFTLMGPFEDQLAFRLEF